MDPRYDHIIEAAKTNLVPDKERTQYLRAMLSDYKGVQKGMEQGLQKGMQKGLEKGREEGLLDAASNMLAEGFDVDLVAKCTGLPKEQIQALKG